MTEIGTCQEDVVSRGGRVLSIRAVAAISPAAVAQQMGNRIMEPVNMALTANGMAPAIGLHAWPDQFIRVPKTVSPATSSGPT
jgi:hypothetical protein